ncbi:hypothetical protein FCR2A7T_05820 [Flavobacterium cauense R2A-7]|uniref:Lipoprotein n=1 Tax=Flavobacterium cauense R2A-7 TaxID=1341154 RepID=V6SA67_9FLAO|nr:hypothetical protein [Flavobacterium cauense]ESU21285.1 hypothetical protein FCR2A7T_05820 [Flavobacterium cauense R2A-7]KGO80065.1 hypothetical protein Q762_13300 [Flavobacterium cauense R2A-7]TWI09004.1 hypothetical protein IP98_02718 [Flavobacterium cauense R2A-7]
MRKTISFLLLIVLYGCSDKISPYFESNTFINENSSVINDSLKFSHKSYGDVKFIKSKPSLKKHLKENRIPFDNVLLYGKTYIDPIYEYYILADSKKRFKSKNQFQKDTLIGNHTFTFIGIPLDKSNPKEDFEKLSANIISGENYAQKLPSIYDIIESNKSSNQFLKGLTEFTHFPAYTKQEKWNKLQMQLTYASFLGQNSVYEELIQQWNPSKINDTIASVIKNHATKGLENVKREILEKANKEKLVMFNENHFYPNHRVLLTKLLPELKKSGFRYLALETLDEKKDSILNHGGKLDMETGFYTREQYFAELIRTAQSLGFQFVAYENQDKSKDREMGQAENLYNNTFAKDSSAKVIVLAGISHITEQPDINGKKWMAQLFKETYNIDPLTFSQTHLNSNRKATESVALLKNGYLAKKYEATDYNIINNLNFKDEKGAFSYKNADYNQVQVALYFEDELKKPSDYAKKVPFRSFLLAKNNSFSATLPDVKMRLIVFDEEGKVLLNKLAN